MGRSITLELVLALRDKMYQVLQVRPYNETTKEHEAEIRWKRTASQILHDRYVYQGKACTDRTILFITLCRALGIQTYFVKVKKEHLVHSVAEVFVDGVWYIFDVSNSNINPVQGVITDGVPYDGWVLWKKGCDAWDIGLFGFEDIKKI